MAHKILGGFRIIGYGAKETKETRHPRVRLQNLDSLPDSFAVLAGAQPYPPGSKPTKELFLTLSSDQIMSAIDTYRTALQDSLSEVKKWPQVSEIRGNALTEIDSIGKELTEKTSEASVN